VDDNEENESANHTGMDEDNSIQTTGVEDGNLPDIAGGVEHNEVTGVTQQVDDEPEMDDDDHPVEEEMDRLYDPRSHGRDLRPRKPRDYSHLLHADLEHTTFTQYNVKTGLKIFGEAGAHHQAVVTEMK
jgi:hypothetical protein